MDKNKPNLVLEKSKEEPDPYHLQAVHGSVAVNHIDKKAWIADKDLIETRRPGRQTVLHPILMRMVLDQCGNIDEALALMDRFNVKAAMPGADYHIMIADLNNDPVLVEWLGDEMKVTRTDHATNHYVCKEDLFFKNGCGRDEILKAGLFRTRGAGMSEEFVRDVLKLAVQDPNNKVDRGKTQYTCIYNLNQRTMKIFSFGDLSKSWDYKL